MMKRPLKDSRFIRSRRYLNEKHNLFLLETPVDDFQDSIVDKELYSLSKTEYKRMVAESLSLRCAPDPWVPLWDIQHRNRPYIREPITVLDLPTIRTSFCKNLMDWSKTNILTMGFPSNVHSWHPTTNTTTSRYVANITCVKWDPTGTQLFVATRNMPAFKMFSSEGRLLSQRREKCHSNCHFTCCDFSSLAPLAVIGCSKGAIALYYVNKGLTIIRRTQLFKDAVTNISFSCDSSMFAAVSKKGRLCVYSFYAFQSELYTDLGAPSRTIAWHPWKRSCLVAGTSFGNVTLFNTFTGNTEALYSCTVPSTITGLTFNPITAELVISFQIHNGVDPENIFLDNSRHQINVVASFNRVVDRMDNVGPIDYICWNPDSTQIATAGRDETCRIWDFLPSQIARKFKKEKPKEKKLKYDSACLELSSALGFNLR